MITILTAIFLALALPKTAQSFEKPDDLYAKAAVLMDAETGRVLYGKNESEALPMASTTKIMTLMIALENANPKTVVEVSEYAASMPDVQLGMRSGEKYRLEDLYYSLMLESHNDTAVAIAEGVAGSVDEFARRMNNKAQEIGCKNTLFITPNGLDKEKDGQIHHTTAEDLAKIMSYCIKESKYADEFIKITQTEEYSFDNLELDDQGKYKSGNRHFYCRNHNAFLNMMEGVISGKTGFTGNAGYCYVVALQREERTYVVSLLACGWPNHKTYKWQDTRKLMEYGLENYQYHPFLETAKEKKIPDIKVYGAKTDRIGMEKYLKVKEEIKEDDPKGMLLAANEQVKVTVKGNWNLTAPVKPMTKVGVVTYQTGNQIWAKHNLYVDEKIEKIDFLWCFDRVIEIFVML